MWGSAIFDSSVQRLCPAVQASGVVDRLVFVLSGSFEIWQHVCNTGSGSIGLHLGCCCTPE